MDKNRETSIYNKVVYLLKLLPIPQKYHNLTIKGCMVSVCLSGCPQLVTKCYSLNISHKMSRWTASEVRVPIVFTTGSASSLLLWTYLVE